MLRKPGIKKTNLMQSCLQVESKMLSLLETESRTVVAGTGRKVQWGGGGQRVQSFSLAR